MTDPPHANSTTLHSPSFMYIKLLRTIFYQDKFYLDAESEHWVWLAALRRMQGQDPRMPEQALCNHTEYTMKDCISCLKYNKIVIFFLFLFSQEKKLKYSHTQLKEQIPLSYLMIMSPTVKQIQDCLYIWLAGWHVCPPFKYVRRRE